MTSQIGMGVLDDWSFVYVIIFAKLEPEIPLVLINLLNHFCCCKKYQCIYFLSTKIKQYFC